MAFPKANLRLWRNAAKICHSTTGPVAAAIFVGRIVR
jgi:hypothetical protein